MSSTYNLACYTARNGERDESLSLLQQAVDLGFNNVNIQTDPDLKSLYGDPRFEKIVIDAKQRMAASQSPN